MIKKLIEPKLKDEDSRRKEYILNIILIGSIAMLAMLEFIVVYYLIQRGGSKTAVSLFPFSIFSLLFLGLYVLSRRGLVSVASYLLIAAYFLGNSYAAYRWGVNVPTVLVGYALLIVITGIVTGSRFGFLVSIVIALYTIPIWWAQDKGWILIDPESLTAGDSLALSALYVLIMTVAWLSNREIERSLIRARTSEHALAKQRDNLEIEVEERTRELREAQFAKVEQLYRFAEFGQMASGLFHDLVNFFNAVLLEIQRPDMINSANVVEARERLETAGVLTQQVNDFAEATRKQLANEHPSERFIVRDEIEQVVRFLAYVARKKNVEIMMGGGTESCFGNCFKFHQAMMNLILNAIESYEDGIVHDVKKIVNVEIGTAENILTIKIIDHGAGILEQDQKDIFKPFFSTKGSGKGMGLGLAITKKVIEDDFRGTLTLESALGHGTSFFVRIPLT